MENKLGKDTNTISIPDQVKKFDPIGFENKSYPVIKNRGYQVPSLVDMCIDCISSKYEEICTLHGIDDQFITIITEKISIDIDYSLAMRTIRDENYWRRYAIKGKNYSTDDISNHGMSWKQLCAENYCSQLIETFDYDDEDIILEKDLQSSQDYIFNLTIKKLPSRLDMNRVFNCLPNLFSLGLSYDILDLGMGYDRSLFGMKMSDAKFLSTCLSSTQCLTTLRLPNSQIDDELIRTLMDGLATNETITILDLSHNRISNHGATLISKLLSLKSVIDVLDLSDNQIHVEGGRQLGYSLGFNKSLTSLNLKLNRLTDEGGRLLLENITDSTSLRDLNLASNSLGHKTMEVLEKILKLKTNISQYDFSSNEFTEDDVTSFYNAIQNNHCILYVDFRMNNIDKDSKVMKDINSFIRHNELIRKGVTKQDLLLASK